MKDIEDCYLPHPNSSEFRKYIEFYLHNLEKTGRLELQGGAARIRDILKPKSGYIKESTAFYIWVNLCSERQWENGWKNILNDEFYDKLQSLLGDPSKFPEYPHPQTLRNHLRKFKNKTPEEFLSRVVELSGSIEARSNISAKLHLYKEIYVRMLDIICKAKHIKKRTLQRKLHIEMDVLNELLNKAGDRIHRMPVSNKGEWIIFIK